jgi:ribosomal protein L7Ae-like RNA K-turn-binding protein
VNEAPAASGGALRLLGLAHRAGKLQLGASAVLRALSQERPGIVFLARDASPRLVGRIERAVGTSFLDRATFVTQELSQALGRERLAVVSIHDAGFVSGLREYVTIRGEDS